MFVVYSLQAVANAPTVLSGALFHVTYAYALALFMPETVALGTDAYTACQLAMQFQTRTVAPP
jgi:hypothetical protein